MKRSKRLTIFEGADGSGKTMTAKEFAALTNARYVHFPALPHVGSNLGRMYVEAMLPALLGYQDVVFDRSWLSEMPYGAAFREGRDRLTDASRRMLERLAMRCGAVVVLCNPPWEQVRDTYLSRRQVEMLKNTDQLKMVYELYQNQGTELPGVVYDYTAGDASRMQVAIEVETRRHQLHPLNVNSAGNWQAPTVLVGETFAERKDNDSFYQWPFASFSSQGCSQWLTEQLHLNGIPERDLLWLNADQDLSVLYDLQPERVIALGKEAYSQLYKLKILATAVSHPQYHKRFNANQHYELFNIL